MNLLEFKRYLFSRKTRIFYELILDQLPEWNMPEGILFERFSMNDLELLKRALIERDFDSDFTFEDALERLENNYNLYVLKKNEEIAGYFWVALDNHYFFYLDSCIKLEHDEANGVFLYIRKDLRGLNLFHNFMCFVLSDLKKRGYRRFLGDYAATNISSHRAHLKFGIMKIGNIYHGYFLTLRYLIKPKALKNKITRKDGHFYLWKKIINKMLH